MMAETGHSSSLVTPMTMSAPTPNWSHFDFFKWTCIIVGDDWLSTATSPHERQVDSLKDPTESGRSSPSRKNPKKAVLATAQITRLAGFDDLSRASLIFLNRKTVMGSLILAGEPFSSRILLMPACTLLCTGREDFSLGFGRPNDICQLLSADKYDLIVCETSCWSIRMCRGAVRRGEMVR